MAGILTAAPAAPPPQQLAPLREELTLEPGPRGREGAPSWTLQDPARGRFFRLGWLEFEMLARWRLGTAAAIAEAIGRETTLRPAAEEVEGFARFLAGAGLLAVGGPAGIARLLRQRQAARPGWAGWLLHHYLFIRIPLLRPDRLLGALLARLGWVYSRGFLAATLAAWLLGLFLALRQWDGFRASFLHFFTLEGALLGLLSLVLAKALHELGHGLTAKRLGCRVPAMGIALVVLYPMLYTDTSEAWRLPARRQRLAVGAAGILAELGLACWALLAWSLLPEGPLRSVAFTWATTTWVLTLVVNLSPFMRFDGYYLLADALEVPNLQDRAFALARWRLREALFGFGEPMPEPWPPGLRRILLGWAICTWAYRLTVFLGIALLVYHLAFKLLGLLLFAIEIWWFIARPILAELGAWVARRRAMRLNRQGALSLAGLALLLAALGLPWGGQVAAPGLLGAERHATVFARVPGRVEAIAARLGEEVAEGQALLQLGSPDLEHRIAQAARRVAALDWQVAMLGQDRDYVARSQLLFRELQAARTERQSLEAERARLAATAPFAGTVVALGDPLAPGTWVRTGEALAEIADLRGARVEAYVAEADLRRIAAGAAAVFVPEDPGLPRHPLRLATVDDLATRLLPDAELASTEGGALPVRRLPQGGLVPEIPVYRLRFDLLGTADTRRVQRGTVLVEAARESLAARAWRQALGLLLRESGF